MIKSKFATVIFLLCDILRIKKEIILRTLSVIALGVGLSLAFTGTARAVGEGVCEGLSGPALGLCSGAIRAGCEGGAESPACEALAETYEDLGLGDPTWLAECPCNYLDVPMTAAAWDLTHAPFFQCPTPPGQISVIADTINFPCGGSGEPSCVGVETSVNVLIFATSNTHICAYSNLADENVGFTTFAAFNLTDAEAEACRADVIAYGNALELVAASAGGFTFFDNCAAPE